MSVAIATYERMSMLIIMQGTTLFTINIVFNNVSGVFKICMFVVAYKFNTCTAQMEVFCKIYCILSTKIIIKHLNRTSIECTIRKNA